MKRRGQPGPAASEQAQGGLHVVDLPRQVLFIDDLVRILGISRRQIEYLRSIRVFPIPELRGLGKRPKWSRLAVDRYLAEGLTVARRKG